MRFVNNNYNSFSLVLHFWFCIVQWNVYWTNHYHAQQQLVDRRHFQLHWPSWEYWRDGSTAFSSSKDCFSDTSGGLLRYRGMLPFCWWLVGCITNTFQNNSINCNYLDILIINKEFFKVYTSDVSVWPNSQESCSPMMVRWTSIHIQFSASAWWKWAESSGWTDNGTGTGWI